jgi:hypothetical protein
MTETSIEPRITKTERQLYNTELKELKKDIGIVEGGLKRIARRLTLFKNGLYRVHYESFAEFVKSELGVTRSYGYRLINAHNVLTELVEDGVREANLPDTERLCRELSQITDRKLRKNVWERAELMAKQAGKLADTSHIDKATQEVEEEEEGQENEGEDGGEKLKAAHQRQKKEVLEQYRSAQKALSAHLAFEEWEESELASLNNLIISISHQALNIKARLDKHRGKEQPKIVEKVVSRPLT